MKNIFTQHPKSINESYLDHLKAALCFSGNLFIAAVASLIHAFLPFLFVDTASNKVYKIVEFMKRTGRWEGLVERFKKQN